MRSTSRLTARLLVLTGIACMSGCASTAQVEALRAEVEEINAAAARAAEDAARAKRELAELKEALASAETAARQSSTTSEDAVKRSGYKWGELDPQGQPE